MALLADSQDPFGGPRVVPSSEPAMDVLTRDLDAGGKKIDGGVIYDYGGAYYNVKALQFGAAGDGVTDDTAAINAAIAVANANLGTLFFPPGVYRVTPGALSTVFVSVLGTNAYLKGNTDASANLMTVDYSSQSYYSVGIANDSPGLDFHLGFASNGTSVGAANYGLGIIGSYHGKFVIPKAINLLRGVNIDLTSDPSKIFTESSLQIKADSCQDALYIKTTNSNANNVDVNRFDLGTSFNCGQSIVHLDCGTTVGTTSNVFRFDLIEIPQSGSYGVLATGRNAGNIFEYYTTRGLNGGKYFSLDSNCTNNVIIKRGHPDEPFIWANSAISSTTNFVQDVRPYWAAGTFDGSANTIMAFNCSLAKLATGDYRLTFANAVPHTHYLITGNCGHNNTSQVVLNHAINAEPQTTTTCRLQVTDANGVLLDPSIIYVQIVPI